jgi:SAM-dependent methyltransferase
MKVRESGMPAEEVWEGFFNPADMLESLGLGNDVKDVVELGCGYGTFTLPAARVIGGRIYALDLEPAMITRVAGRARAAGIGNIVPEQRDFVADGLGLEDKSIDYALVFHILHAERPVELLRETCRVLKPGGRAGVIHWNYDPSTPRGPPMAIRPKPDQCIAWGRQAGLELIRRLDLPPYHYGLVLRKPAGRGGET